MSARDNQNKSLLETAFAVAAFFISSACAGITGVGAPPVVPIESQGLDPVAAAAATPAPLPALYAGGASCDMATGAGAGAAAPTASQGDGWASAGAGSG